MTPPPLGTFPKIHPFWKGNASLREHLTGKRSFFFQCEVFSKSCYNDCKWGKSVFFSPPMPPAACSHGSPGILGSLAVPSVFLLVAKTLPQFSSCFPSTCSSQFQPLRMSSTSQIINNLFGSMIWSSGIQVYMKIKLLTWLLTHACQWIPRWLRGRVSWCLGRFSSAGHRWTQIRWQGCHRTRNTSKISAINSSSFALLIEGHYFEQDSQDRHHNVE